MAEKSKFKRKKVVTIKSFVFSKFWDYALAMISGSDNQVRRSKSMSVE